jgi:hypothetical protein
MVRTRYVCLAAALLVTACGSAPSTSGDRVATLAGAGPSPTSSAPAAGTKRPQLRLDSSDAEKAALDKAYDDCLIGHGVKVLNVDPSGGKRIDDSGEPKAAYAACAGKLPLPPPELDEDQNPNFAAQWNNDVKCLRSHGFKVHVTNPGEYGFDSDDTPIPTPAIEKACQQEAFGAPAK